MLGKSLRNLGSKPLSIQAGPIALNRSSPDTSKRIKHDLQKAGRATEISSGQRSPPRSAHSSSVRATV
jgi:hypothetical protein